MTALRAPWAASRYGSSFFCTYFYACNQEPVLGAASNSVPAMHAQNLVPPGPPPPVAPQADAEGDVYSLRITITCNHIDHQDKAVVYATVAVPAGGGEVNVTLSDVELDVDESHLEVG
jgi:hypothetical protein